MTDDCIFCRIIAKDIPAQMVYENDTVVAFLDINPVHPGHTLIVSRQHHKDMTDTPDGLLAEMITQAKRIGIALLDNRLADGFCLGMNNRGPAGQIVFHTHLHVIPRLEHDGLRHWPKQKDVAPAVMQQVQEKLVASLRKKI